MIVYSKILCSSSRNCFRIFKNLQSRTWGVWGHGERSVLFLCECFLKASCPGFLGLCVAFFYHGWLGFCLGKRFSFPCLREGPVAIFGLPRGKLSSCLSETRDIALAGVELPCSNPNRCEPHWAVERTHQVTPAQLFCLPWPFCCSLPWGGGWHQMSHWAFVCCWASSAPWCSCLPKGKSWCYLVSGMGILQHFGSLFVLVGWWGLTLWYVQAIYFLFFFCLLAFGLLIKRCWWVFFSLSFISIHSLLAERDSWKSKGYTPDSWWFSFKLSQNETKFVAQLKGGKRKWTIKK